MDVSILYPSRPISLDCPSTVVTFLYFTPWAQIILCVRAHHLTEPTWVGLGPIKPGPGTKAQSPRNC